MKLSLETYNAISALKPIVTNERFLELTNKTPPPKFTEEYGQLVLAHLQKLEPYYALYHNIIQSRQESLSVKKMIADDFIDDVIPYLVNVRSKELNETITSDS